jgi:hypothetical protein
MEKKIITEIKRIHEIMGVEKKLITEGPLPRRVQQFIEDLFYEVDNTGQVTSKWARPSGEFGTVGRNGMRTIDIETSAGPKTLNISRADNDAINSFLSPPRPGVVPKTWDKLTNQQRAIIWDILDDALRRRGEGSEFLYDAWVAPKIDLKNRYSELDVLDDIARRNESRNQNNPIGVEEYLISKKNIDPTLAKKITPEIEKRIQLMRKGSLTLDKDLRAVSNMDPELEDFLKNLSKLSPENVKKIAEKGGILKELAGEVDGVYTQMKSLLKNLQDATPANREEIELAIARTMREFLGARENLKRNMDRFISELESSTDEELKDIAKKLKDVKKRYTKNDDWSTIDLPADLLPPGLKWLKAVSEGLKPSRLFYLEKNIATIFGGVARWIKRIFTKKPAITQEEATQAGKKLSDAVKTEFPTWQKFYRRLFSGSERGYPGKAPLGTGTQRGTVDIGGVPYRDPYEKLRPLGDVGTVRLPYWTFKKGWQKTNWKMSYATLSYFAEAIAVTLKWMIYEATISTLFPWIAFHFYGKKGNYTCYNELVDFFDKKKVYEFGVILEFLENEKLKATMPKCIDNLLEDQSKMGMNLNFNVPYIGLNFGDYNFTSKKEMIAARLDYMLNNDKSRKEENEGITTFGSEFWENFGPEWFTVGGITLLTPQTIDNLVRYGVNLIQRFAEWDAGSPIEAPEKPKEDIGGEESFKLWCKDNAQNFVSFKDGIGTSSDPGPVGAGETRCWTFDFNVVNFVQVDCPTSKTSPTKPPTTDTLPSSDTSKTNIQQPSSVEKVNVEPLDSNKLKDIQKQLKQKYGN